MSIPKVGSGDFADVFDMDDGTVVKAFRRVQHTGGDIGEWGDEDALTTELFEAEVRAYECLRQFPELALFSPIYHGRTDPCGLSELNDSERCLYVECCGIRLEKISGEAVKVGCLDPRLKEEVRPILEQIASKVTSGNVWDSSCFFPGSRASFTLIDFAVWEHFLDCVDVLEQQRRFTDQQREILGLIHCL